MGRRWTEDELIYLEYCFFDTEDVSLDEMVKFLGRTRSAINGKAVKMRKGNKNFGYIRDRYSDEDIKRIISANTHMQQKELAELMGRSQGGLHWKMKDIGINKNKRLSDYDSEIRRLASSGIYRAEMSRRLGLRENSLYYYMKKHGIECQKAPREANQKHFRDDETMRFAALKERSLQNDRNRKSKQDSRH